MSIRAIKNYINIDKFRQNGLRLFVRNSVNNEHRDMQFTISM